MVQKSLMWAMTLSQTRAQPESKLCLSSSQANKSYVLQEQPFFLAPSSMKTSDLFHLPQTKDS